MTTLAALARLVEGELDGTVDLELTGAATLEEAQPGEITFVENAVWLPRLASTAASAAIVPRGTPPQRIPLVFVEDVTSAFARAWEHFCPRAKREPTSGVSPAAHVHPSVQLAEGVVVEAGATIGEDVTLGRNSRIHSAAVLLSGCRIGADVTIFPGAVLHEDTIVGDRCIIHANVTVGSFGFGYATKKGRHHLRPQLGHVQIGSDVEIGANSSIDRGTYGATTIGEGTKIDNLVQIAHNCRIGRHNIICSQVGIAGSTSSGDYAVIAGQVGIRDHVHIGEGAVISAKSGVSHDLPAGSQYMGYPAVPAREQRVRWAALAKLPELRKKVKELERTVKSLLEERAQEPPRSGRAA